MEATKEECYLKRESGLQKEFLKRPCMQVDVKLERDSEDEAESEMDILYADHIVIKEEMVIGPTVLQETVHHNSNCSKDALAPKKLDEKTNKEDSQKDTIKAIDTEEKITSNVDLNINAWANKQGKLKVVRRSNKPHSCTLCDYKTTEKGNFIRHLRIHSGEKPYSCTLCDHKCSDKQSLTNHLRIHTGEKPYSCTLCDYKCSEKRNLKRHLKVHTGEKPHSCTVCKFKCIQKNKLTRHIKIHSGKKPRNS